MDPQQQFCLKWNSYSSNLAITFSNLFKSDVLADVTLSCDGTVFKAHKLILAACSKKFAELFESTPTNGQCVVILEATSSDNMAALLEFMYKGEVHVSQEALNSFLKSAENLQVKGLSTETGRLAAQQAHQHTDASPLESPNSRRSLRNSISGGGAGNISAGVGGSPLTSIGGIPSGAIIGGNIAATMAGNADRNSNSGGANGGGGVGGAGSGSSGGIGCNIISGPISAHCNITAPGAGATGGGGPGGPCGPGGPGGMGSGAGVVHHLSSSSGNLKQECDSLMQSSTAAALAAGIPPYVPPIYRPLSFEPLRKRVLRSPYGEQEVRGSVLRDGSKNSSSECASPISKPPYHRPSSSASSNAPTEGDTMQSERTSPGRYENHSPGATAGNGNNAPSNLSTSSAVKTERNNGSTHEANDDDRSEHDESIDNGAEDLRVKLENSNYSPPPPQPPTSNASSTTPSALLENLKNAEAGLPSNLATSIAPEDMLNVWNATKLNNKNSGMVNTADGKKLKCLYCDRLYGYETNLRAHIRQRHQGIRVHCPFCSRTFTRNNTVRRHIAREHKQEIGLSAASTGIVPASVAAAAAAAAANHSQ